MAGADQQHAQPGLADAAADGLGQLPIQQHLVEGQLPALVAVCRGQLAVQSRGIYPDPHGGQLKAPLQHGIPHEDVAVQLPVVIVRSPAVVALAGGQGLADLHQEHSPVLAADLPLPLVGGQVGKAVLQLLGGDEIHVPVRLEGQDREGVAQSGGGVADGPHDVPHSFL